jgi:hypothetical protein
MLYVKDLSNQVALEVTGVEPGDEVLSAKVVG